MRRTAKRDGNHGVIVDRFRALGCSVFETDRVGEGFPDTVVGCIGVNHLVEIKNSSTRYGRAGFNRNQTSFNAAWRGDKVWLVCSEDEATAVVQNWRKGVP
jgi:predicted transcriptional regulator